MMEEMAEKIITFFIGYAVGVGIILLIVLWRIKKKWFKDIDDVEKN